MNQDDQPISDADVAAYHRWLLHSVLAQGRTTRWCAKELDMDPIAVLRDFNVALMSGCYFDSGKDIGIDGVSRSRPTKGKKRFK